MTGLGVPRRPELAHHVARGLRLWRVRFTDLADAARLGLRSHARRARQLSYYCGLVLSICDSHYPFYAKLAKLGPKQCALLNPELDKVIKILEWGN